MNERTDLDRVLAAWVVADAPRTPPDDLLSPVFAVTSMSRPMPAWRALLSVPPMRTQSMVLVGSPTLRLARVVVALVLLAGLIVAALLIGGSQLPDAEQLVRESQRAHANPPAFTMTTTAFGSGQGMGSVEPSVDAFDGCYGLDWLFDGNGTKLIRYHYDGSGRLRKECDNAVSEPIDAFMVLDSDGTGGMWVNGAWEEIEWDGQRPGGIPLATVDWLNWLNIWPGYRGPMSGPATCPSWRLGPVDVVAGRPAREVSCEADRYWIDEASGLIVRREAAGVLMSKALDLEVGVQPEASLLEIPPRMPSQLIGGRIPSDWTLPRVGGGTFSSASLRGRPAAVLFGPDTAWCSVALSLEDFAAVVLERGDRLGSVALWAGGTYPEAWLRQAEAAGVPVVLRSPDTGWHSDASERVWLLDAEGRAVAGADPCSRSSLAAMLDALLSGSAIPYPPNGDGVFVVGEPAPPLVGTFSDGRPFDLRDFAGRPAVVLQPGDWGCKRTEDLAAARALVGDRATFVILEYPLGYCTGEGGAVVQQPSGVYVMSDKDAPAWEALWRGRALTAMVIVDANGVVDRVLSDELPGPAELAELLAPLIGASD